MRLANVGDGALADPLYGMEVSLQQQVMERLREASHAIEASKLHATQEAQIWLANIHAQVTAAMGQLASTSSDLTSRLSEVQNLLMVVQDNIASHVDQVFCMPAWQPKTPSISYGPRCSDFFFSGATREASLYMRSWA